MSPEALAEALGIPKAAQVYRRLPKTSLRKPFRSKIPKALETLGPMVWVAALKPTSARLLAIPSTESQDDVSELHVVHVLLKDEASRIQAPAVVHRAIPYPVLVVAQHRGHISVSTASKRPPASGVGSFVLQGPIVSGPWWKTTDERVPELLRRLSVPATAHSGSLAAIARQWDRAIESAKTAERLGCFVEDQLARSAWTARHDELTTAIRQTAAVLRTASQMRDKVAARTTLKSLEAELARHEASLTPEHSP